MILNDSVFFFLVTVVRCVLVMFVYFCGFGALKVISCWGLWSTSF